VTSGSDINGLDLEKLVIEQMPVVTCSRMAWWRF